MENWTLKELNVTALVLKRSIANLTELKEAAEKSDSKNNARKIEVLGQMIQESEDLLSKTENLIKEMNTKEV